MLGKIAYITAETPFGKGETFILTEMYALRKLNVDLLIIPRDNLNKVFHEKAKALINSTVEVPLFNLCIAKELLKFILKYPFLFYSLIYDVVFGARNLKIAFKNLAIIPKALYLCRIIREKSIKHVHAHWGGTTSSMAYIISKVTEIPWSFTVHRWDIPENNLLRKKCISASFVRAIDKKGREEVIEIINDPLLNKKISVIHMGVCIPESNESSRSSSDIFTILCPADLVPKKGHNYLLKACKLLLDKNIKYKCLLAGYGPLEEELKKEVSNFNLNNYIEFLGRVLHENLLDLYESRNIDAVVLPSIVDEHEEKEGIPVALMEAMAYGIPVISTNTGGIPELIGDGSGVMVDEKDPESIAASIEKLMNDTNYYNDISRQGNGKVGREFNVYEISKVLLERFGVQ